MVDSIERIRELCANTRQHSRSKVDHGRGCGFRLRWMPEDRIGTTTSRGREHAFSDRAQAILGLGSREGKRLAKFREPVQGRGSSALARLPSLRDEPGGFVNDLKLSIESSSQWTVSEWGSTSAGKCLLAGRGACSQADMSTGTVVRGF